MAEELTDQNTQGTDEGESDKDYIAKFGDREIHLKSPGSGALAMFTAASARRNGAKQVAGMLDFFVNRIENEVDREWVEEGLLEDDIELEDVMEHIENALVLWSEDPTSASSGSARQSRATGQRSTGASRRATRG